VPRELRTGVWCIEGSASNVYVTVDHAAPVDDTNAVRVDGETGALVLLDAGTPGDAATIREGVEAAGFAVADVSRVLLTHYDYDHVGALAELDDLDATVYAHEPDASFLDGSATPDVWPHKALLQRLTGRFLSRPSGSVERVRGGDTVGSFTAYHTPGHGPGHLAWVSGRRRFWVISFGSTTAGSRRRRGSSATTRTRSATASARSRNERRRLLSPGWGTGGR